MEQNLKEVVVKKPEPEVSNLEVREIKEQPKVFEPAGEPEANNHAQGGDLIASVKEALQIDIGTKNTIKATVEATREVFTTTNLNLRSGPGAKYPSVKVIEKGGRLLTSDRAGKWIKVEADGRVVGWVNQDFVTILKQK